MARQRRHVEPWQRLVDKADRRTSLELARLLRERRRARQGRLRRHRVGHASAACRLETDRRLIRASIWQHAASRVLGESCILIAAIEVAPVRYFSLYSPSNVTNHSMLCFLLCHKKFEARMFLQGERLFPDNLSLCLKSCFACVASIAPHAIEIMFLFVVYLASTATSNCMYHSNCW